MNMIILTGNVTKTPELRHTASGKTWTKFSIAVNDIFRDAEGVVKTKPFYFDIAAWDKLANNICKNVVKGMTVTLHGKLEVSFYRDNRFQVKGKPLSRKNVQITANYVSWKSTPKEEEIEDGSTTY
jgi:single-strand DNA-binding protein